MKKSLLIFPIVVISFYLTLCGSVSFPRAGAQQLEKVELTNFSGATEVLLEGLDEYTPAQEGMILESGDKIKTASSSSAELSFNEDNTNLVRLNENTNVQVSLSADEKLVMTEGEIFSSISELPSGSAFEIRTPTAVTGARGTDWVTRVTKEGTDVEALESSPYVRHFEADGTISQQITSINPGQMTTVRKFQKPMPPRLIADTRRQQLQKVKQEVRRNAGEAVIKRQQRPPFDRQKLFKKLKEQRDSNKSTFKPSLGGQQNNSGVLISRERDRYSPKLQTSDQAQMSHPKDQRSLSGERDKDASQLLQDSDIRDEKNKSIIPKTEEKSSAEQKLKIEGKKPAGDQPQANETGSGKQGKPPSKNSIAPKAAARGGGRR